VLAELAVSASNATHRSVLTACGGEHVAGDAPAKRARDLAAAVLDLFV
jgi:hypothetical protein